MRATSRRQLTYTSHPLAILNISDHFTRAKYAGTKSSKSQFCLDQELTVPVVGVLLGTQTGRNMSIVNSFELPSSDGSIDEGFFRTRRDQC